MATEERAPPIQPTEIDPKLAVPMALNTDALRDNDRATVTINVHHEHYGEMPQSASYTFSRFLDTQEQPYQRRAQAQQAWGLLDTGWLGEAVGILCLENRAGLGLLTNPTDEEQDAIDAQVVELGVAAMVNDAEGKPVSGCVPFAQVPPGCSTLFHACPGVRYYLRCLGASTRVNLFILPK